GSRPRRPSVDLPPRSDLAERRRARDGALVRRRGAAGARLRAGPVRRRARPRRQAGADRAAARRRLRVHGLPPRLAPRARPPLRLRDARQGPFRLPRPRGGRLMLTNPDWQSLNEQLSARPLRPITLLLLAADLALLAASWSLWSHGRWWAVLAWPLLLLALIHLYLILHEAIHGSVARRRWVNHLVGNVCGTTFLLPFFTRQRNHLLHHVWAGHPVGDPENQKMIARFSVMTAADARRLELVWRLWLPVITLNHFVDHWRDPVRQLRAGNRSPRIVREARFALVYLAGYALVAAALAAAGDL